MSTNFSFFSCVFEKKKILCKHNSDTNKRILRSWFITPHFSAQLRKQLSHKFKYHKNWSNNLSFLSTTETKSSFHLHSLCTKQYHSHLTPFKEILQRHKQIHILEILQQIINRENNFIAFTSRLCFQNFLCLWVITQCYPLYTELKHFMACFNVALFRPSNHKVYLRPLQKTWDTDGSVSIKCSVIHKIKECSFLVTAVYRKTQNWKTICHIFQNGKQMDHIEMLLICCTVPIHTRSTWFQVTTRV